MAMTPAERQKARRDRLRESRQASRVTAGVTRQPDTTTQCRVPAEKTPVLTAGDGSPLAPARSMGGGLAHPFTVEPCTEDQYKMACERMIAGDNTGDVLAKAGIKSWSNLSARGAMYGPDTWSKVQAQHKEARINRVITKAQAVAEQACDAIATSTEAPQGTTTTKQRRTDAAMIAQVLAGLDPDTHGRQAGRSKEDTRAGVVVVVQVGSNPPPPPTIIDVQ